MDLEELKESIDQDKKDLRLMVKAVVYGSFFMILTVLIIGIIRGL